MEFRPELNLLIIWKEMKANEKIKHRKYKGIQKFMNKMGQRRKEEWFKE